MTTDTKLKPLLVTTLHKGVFYGWGLPEIAENRMIKLEKAQMCVSWNASIHGVFGLAATGPDSNCRIGPAVSELHLTDVTSVAVATPEAVKAWEKLPWVK